MTLPPIGLGCAVPCDLLPDSQFLCWSHSAKALALNTAKMLHLSMPSHLGVSYIIPCVLPLTWVLSQSMVLQSTSMWPCVTYLVDCFTDSLFLCCACVCTFGVSFCGLKSQSHLDDSCVHATAQCFLRVFAQVRPTMSRIPLVHLIKCTKHPHFMLQACMVSLSSCYCIQISVRLCLLTPMCFSIHLI